MKRTLTYRRACRVGAHPCRGRRGGAPSVPRLPGPGVAIRRSDAQLHPLLGSASGRDDDGTEPGLQDAAAAPAASTAGGALERRRRRLAELQPDAHVGALFAARRDQRQDRRQAQDPVHVRHQTIHELRVRPDHGQRGPDRHDADRHFLDQSGHLRRELAHARGPSALDPHGHARGGLFRRHAVSRIPGWASAGL